MEGKKVIQHFFEKVLPKNGRVCKAVSKREKPANLTGKKARFSPVGDRAALGGREKGTLEPCYRLKENASLNN